MKQWLSSLTLSSQARAAALNAIDAIGGGDRQSVVVALSSLLEIAVAQLDQSSVAELHGLMGQASAGA